ncbi:MAG: glycosyltransferase family 2 protein [Bacteroidota bacterium]
MNLLTISVVIPCRNEIAYIEECIRAVFASTLEQSIKLSVFVVDGMSDDGTREKIGLLKHEFQQLFIVDNPNQLTPFAFNLGIRAHDFDFVQIIGARHIISKSYIQKCFNILQNDPSIYCVGGAVQNHYLNETGKLIAMAMSTSLGMGLGNFRTKMESGFVDTVGTPMYPKKVFEEVGYFDEELIRNQDDEFNFRVTKVGGKIFFEASIFLKYYVRGSFQNLWKQFYQYGYWKVYVNQKHKAVTTYRQLVPPAFVAYLLLTCLSFVFGLKIGGLFMLPIVLYLTLAAYVAMDLKSKDAKVSFFALFQTFPILHISYGLGYLKGIWDFMLLSKKPSENQKTLSR